MSKIRLGEPIFRSVQGEGNRTGVLSIWVRFFGCNLKCEGFYQKDPTDQSTWTVPEVLNNGKIYKNLSDVPILTTGCDSGYSWHPNFKHLAIDYAKSTTLFNEISPLLYNNKWRHPITKNEIDLCFTGGEPLMQQKAIVSILKEANVDCWRKDKGNLIPGLDYPETVQIETNGTKPLVEEFKEFYLQNAFSLNWNVSPKLFNVSGEQDAVKYDIIREYFTLSNKGCLKFVVNSKDECWNELNQHVKELSDLDIPIYIMPCGSTREQQEEPGYMAEIANRAIAEGYHFSGRLHSHIWGNGIGT